MQKYGESLRTIGCGTFGKVTKHSHNNQLFALKTVLNEEGCEREHQICEFLRVHTHPNIVQIVEVITQPLVIVMLYISKTLGDVLGRMNLMNKRLKHMYATMILHGIASGLAFLHSHGLIHRDLKPANILIEMSTYTPKICDFGSCKFLTAVNVTYICTRFYRAPEQILDCQYAFSADMWSFGCVACEIAIGSPFFVGDDSTSQLVEIIKKIGMLSEKQLQEMKGSTLNFGMIPAVHAKPWTQLFTVQHQNKKINTSYGSQFEDFVSQILKWVPSERMTARECLLHSFLKQEC